MVDSLRHDMIGKYTPFMRELAEQGLKGILEPPLSYCLHPTWFAGLNPESSDRFLHNIYSPQTSFYQRLKLFSFLRIKSLVKNFGFLGSSLPTSPYGGAPRIPNHLLQYFDNAETLPPWDPEYSPHITLFDIFRHNDVDWLFIGSPGSNQQTFSIVHNFKTTLSKRHSFIWLHFAELDWVCHKYGPDSAQSMKKLLEIDNAIRSINTHLREKHIPFDILVFGDHGHVPVDKTIDLQSFLKKTGLLIHQDYIYFLDSTVARFWFRNRSALNALFDALSELNCGTVLTTPNSKKTGYDFKNIKHGQMIWVADEGYMIYPNFWQGFEKVKGMHGYLPEVKKNHAGFVMSSPQIHKITKSNGEHKLVDVFPTLLDLMHLPIPASNEGTSFLPT